MAGVRGFVSPCFVSSGSNAFGAAVTRPPSGLQAARGAASSETDSDKSELNSSTRYRQLSIFWQAVTALLTALSVLLAVNQIFNLGFLVGHVLLDARYLYLLTGTMLAMVFIYFPAHSGAPRRHVPWYDALLGLAVLMVCGYFAWSAERIVSEAWEFTAPQVAVWMSFAGWLLVLEAGRRAGGLPVFVIVALCSTYPLYADQVPAFIAGLPMALPQVASFHMFSVESLLGIPMQAFGLLVFGFLVFGVLLSFTGAGPFFINLAFALLGTRRGGPAKVAIFSSGLMGSMSGGPVTNVLTTGPLSIPAMRRIGFSRSYAAGVEACASTGGVLMPPIMGATAFVMANFLGISYLEVALAAIVPSALYYFGLFMQIDAYAARRDLQGLPASELPSTVQVLRRGWYFLFVFAALIWMLVGLNREATAPFYAAALLLVINQFTPYRLTRRRFVELMARIGQMLAELAGILAAIGLIIGALQVTGMAGTFTNNLVRLAGDDLLALVLMGALTSFIFGIGMTVTAAYLFLAIVLAPSLIRFGIDPLAAHLFLMYWGMLSFITPPVALAAFAAGSVANCSPMRAGFQAMRLGTIIYFIPFFFVFNPALLLQGAPGEIAVVVSTAVIGVAFVAAALQGWLIGFGSLGHGPLGLVARLLLAVAGLLFTAPGGDVLGLGEGGLLLLSSGLLAAALLLSLPARKMQPDDRLRETHVPDRDPSPHDRAAG